VESKARQFNFEKKSFYSSPSNLIKLMDSVEKREQERKRDETRNAKYINNIEKFTHQQRRKDVNMKNFLLSIFAAFAFKRTASCCLSSHDGFLFVAPDNAYLKRRMMWKEK
jgi:hypothetical protein